MEILRTLNLLGRCVEEGVHENTPNDERYHLVYIEIMFMDYQPEVTVTVIPVALT
jgi:hypothetical protein